MSRALARRLIVPLVLLASAMPAVAQVESREGIALQNQILELRRQMQTLQDQANRGGGSPTNLGRSAYPQSSTGGSDLVAQLLSRVDALEEQVRQLRGRLMRPRTRCSARVPTWASGSTIWHFRLRTLGAGHLLRQRRRSLAAWR